MDDNKIGTYKFVAEPFHVDFTGRLTMGVLGNHLLNCAGFHAAERGFGIAEINEISVLLAGDRFRTFFSFN